MKKAMTPLDMARVTALDKAMAYHQTFNRPAQQVGQMPYVTDHPKATPDQVIETASKFLGFLLVERKAMRPRATR